MTRSPPLVNALQQSDLSPIPAVFSQCSARGGADRGVAASSGRSRGTHSKEIQMDASTGLGLAGGGLVLFLVTLLVVGALSGLLVGALARFVLPGPDPMSWGKTLLFGIGGSFIGGVVGRVLHVPESLGFVLSVACAAGLIWYFTRRNRSSGTPPAAS
jgi:uncharacterized membrane protein YeaQ/YmgE (transglycosylase-associated protein family)